LSGQENNKPLSLLNETNVLTDLSTQQAVFNLFRNKSVRFLQDNALSTVKSRNFVSKMF